MTPTENLGRQHHFTSHGMGWFKPVHRNMFSTPTHFQLEAFGTCLQHPKRAIVRGPEEQPVSVMPHENETRCSEGTKERGKQ